MKHFIIFIILITHIWAMDVNKNLNKLIKKKEKEFLIINDSGIKSIEFNKGFYRITFNDKKVICENDFSLSDNCNFMINKKQYLNNYHANIFIEKLLNYNFNDKFFIKQKFGINQLFYIVDPLSNDYKKIQKNIKEINKKLSIILLPLSNDLKKINTKMKLKLNKKDLDFIHKIYNNNKFELPSTIILNKTKGKK